MSVCLQTRSRKSSRKDTRQIFPKKDAAVKRTVKIVKKAARPVIEEPPEPGEEILTPIEALSPRP